MSDVVTKPCPQCGIPQPALEVKVPVLVDGGMQMRPFPIARMCDACAEADERRRSAESFDALMEMVRERSEIPLEFTDAELSTHPDGEARAIGEGFLATLPDPLDEFLAVREWTRTIEQRAELARLQRAKMRDVRAPGLYGLQGRGKSGLYAAIGNALVRRGISPVIANVTMLLQEIEARRSDGRATESLLRPLRESAFTVLDDLDKVSNATYDGKPTSAAQRGFYALFSVQEYRMQHRLPTGVTANRSLQRLKTEVFAPFGGDGAAFCDRFLKTTGAWYELRAARSYRVPGSAA